MLSLPKSRAGTLHVAGACGRWVGLLHLRADREGLSLFKVNEYITAVSKKLLEVDKTLTVWPGPNDHLSP